MNADIAASQANTRHDVQGGAEVEGRLMRSDMIITRKDADHELKQQHFTLANGTGTEWLAVQYQYTRHKTP